MEFSRPFKISQELVRKYEQNKREGCGKLLVEVEELMRSVTMTAPSYHELRNIYLVRDLYMPKDQSKLTKE